MTAFIGQRGRKRYNILRNLSTGTGEGEGEKPDPLKYAVKVYDKLDRASTQLTIREENKRKAGIYCIYNKINGSIYVGSAITNRINVRFRNH